MLKLLTRPATALDIALAALALVLFSTVMVMR